MKQLIDLLRKLGIVHISSGDSITGEFDSSWRESSSDEDVRAPRDEQTPQNKIGGVPVIVRIAFAILAVMMLLGALSIGFWAFIIVVLLWGVCGWILWHYSLTFVMQLVMVLLFGFGTFLYIGFAGDASPDGGDGAPLAGPNVEIYVEGESGELSGKQSYSYLGESARGGEAYLGDGGATASYTVMSPQGGEYTLAVKLSDDALHPNGVRNATLVVNGTSFQYEHLSENTNGWKWYELGTATLSQGENSVTITKDTTTSAAFVMDAFTLTPVE